MAHIKLTEFVTVFLILFEVICKIGKCNSLCFNKLQICLECGITSPLILSLSPLTLISCKQTQVTLANCALYSSPCVLKRNIPP